jgi:hypothetical protein
MSYPYEGYPAQPGPAPTSSAGSGPATQPLPTNSSPQPYQGNGADPMNVDPAGAPGTGGVPDSKTTLWYYIMGSNIDACRMGELEPWVDESYVRNIWYGMGEQVNVKMIRDKFTGYKFFEYDGLIVETTLDTVLLISCRRNRLPKQ